MIVMSRKSAEGLIPHENPRVKSYESMVAEAFYVWLAENPDVKQKEKMDMFDKIADEAMGE